MDLDSSTQSPGTSDAVDSQQIIVHVNSEHFRSVPSQKQNKLHGPVKCSKIVAKRLKGPIPVSVNEWENLKGCNRA